MFQPRLFSNLKHFQKAYSLKYVHFRNKDKYVGVSETLQELVSRNLKTIEDWRQVKEDVLKISNRFTRVNVDSTLLNGYISADKYEHALKYIQFLKTEEKDLNLAVLNKLFKVYYGLYAEISLPEEKEKEIIEMTNEILSKYQVLDTFTSEGIIFALSLTKDWKKCLNILKDMQVVSKPSHACYNTIITTAFKHEEDETAWTILEEMLSNRRTPSDKCFLAYIKKLEALSPAEQNKKIDTLFNFFNINDFICGQELIMKIQEIFVKNKMAAKVSNISSRGLCNVCKKTIPAIKLKDDEFNQLKKAFMERVIVGKNVFSKTTPDELERFKEFVGQNKKYDVIIDGLNVAYSTGVDKNTTVFSRLIACVVRHYSLENKSILVLGRKHMSRWPLKYMNFIQQNSDLFLTDNISQDDPYLLYCALNSGMHTVIVTRDLMRSHIHLLKDPEQKQSFSRWLNLCQHKLIRVLANDDVVIQHPLPFVRTAQKLDSVWHIPYTTGSEINDDNWLCIQTKET